VANCFSHGYLCEDATNKSSSSWVWKCFSIEANHVPPNAHHYQVTIGNVLSWSYFEFVKMSMATFHKRGNGCLANIFIISSVTSCIVIPNWMCAFINPFWVSMRCLTCSQRFLSIFFSAYSIHSCIGLFTLNNFFCWICYVLKNMTSNEYYSLAWTWSTLTFSVLTLFKLHIVCLLLVCLIICGRNVKM